LRLTSVKLEAGVMLPKPFWAGSVGHEDTSTRAHEKIRLRGVRERHGEHE
jgi:hypothetical protein